MCHHSVLNRSAIDKLQLRVSGGLEDNPILRFDVSNMDGKSWDSVILRLVCHTASLTLNATTNI